MGDILDRIGLQQSDLFDKDTSRNGSDRPEIVDTYDYLDETGTVLYQVVRMQPKGFRQRRPDGKGGWIWKLGDTRRVLYRLPKVQEAADNGEVIWITEGERDVHALEAAGVVATTNAGGAGAWKPEYSACLFGAKEIIVVADKDAPGRAHALAVAESVRAFVPNVSIVQAAEGKDAADHFRAGRTLEDFQAVGSEPAEEEHKVEPPTLNSEAPISGREEDPDDELMVVRPYHRIALDLRNPPPPTPTLVRGIYAGCITVIQSEPGVGKSFIALDIARQVMEGGRDVIYIDEEGGPELVTERLTALGADPDVVAERLHYFAFESRTLNETDLDALTMLIEGVDDLALAVLDSLPDFMAAAGRSEDSAQDVTNFVQEVCGRFRTAGSATLILDHLTKPPADTSKKHRSRYSRGSGAKLAKADATLLVEAVEEFDATTSGMLRMWKTKDRRGRLDLPSLTKEGLLLMVDVEAGKVNFRAVTEPPKYDGPTHCMAAVMEFMAGTSGVELSQRKVFEGMRARGESFTNTTMADALNRLVAKGELSCGSGAKGAILFRLDPVENTQQEALGDADYEAF